MNLKIRTILPLIISALAIMAVASAGFAAYEAYVRRQDAEAFLKINQISQRLLQSAGQWAVERGMTNAPLKSPDAAEVTQPKPQVTRPAAARGPGGFAARAPVRGKPRYLGLVLTVVLLFLLAMIAAWSKASSLASRERATVCQATMPAKGRAAASATRASSRRREGRRSDGCGMSVAFTRCYGDDTTGPTAPAP